MVVSSRIKVPRLQSVFFFLRVTPIRCGIAKEPLSSCPPFSWITGWLSVLSVGVVPCTPVVTTLSSSTTSSFEALQAKSSAWSSDISASACLVRGDSPADMLDAIVNLRRTWWSTIAVIQRGLFFYKSLQVLCWLNFSMLFIFSTWCCSLYVCAMVVQRRYVQVQLLWQKIRGIRASPRKTRKTPVYVQSNIFVHFCNSLGTCINSWSCSNIQISIFWKQTRRVLSESGHALTNHMHVPLLSLSSQSYMHDPPLASLISTGH